MDACVRHLRGDGAHAQGGPSPMALVCDDLECTGGKDVMQQLVQSYLSAMTQGTCTAKSVVLLQLDGSLHMPKADVVHVLGGWTDPAGWLRDAGLVQHQDTITIAGPQALEELLQRLLLNATHGGYPSGACIMVDNLSQLLHYHSAPAVMAFMEQLRNHASVSCIIAALHKDAVDQGSVLALQRMSSCVVSLQPISELQQEVLRQLTCHTAHGCITSAFKSRKAGRLRVETCYYSLQTQGLVVFQAPSDLTHLMNPEALVALTVRNRSTATASTAGAAGAAAAQQQAQAAQQGVEQPNRGTAETSSSSKGQGPMEAAGGMRLTLTEEERRAKQAVVLPFEHKGAGSAYKTGDWRDYLPVAAGGRSAAFNHHSQVAGEQVADGADEDHAKGLGRILYVRDSDDEQGGLHDSDEDPDDDLDI